MKCRKCKYFETGVALVGVTARCKKKKWCTSGVITKEFYQVGKKYDNRWDNCKDYKKVT